mmetsp:Transcript_34249/g.38983  ORF Transcript_34249/g.38983 Transcript_34249/m.38983 type:complete len:268 (+) Transcript_34249:115-918(+)|eukprot:CAMPEP_0194146012 /NCGR_PEP_ID=MMETSP0152-20130528/19227_1 /TAXON_ID=1049557 /ORGANISM="Thalassiothrix antarctica, Strain L6-D1" /LENGTH=267 /DNA_ID=CAMNT_0038846409 /DNA_START=59 /DNA_END=862 /DNA_ORIENTATION=+
MNIFRNSIVLLLAVVSNTSAFSPVIKQQAFLNSKVSNAFTSSRLFMSEEENENLTLEDEVEALTKEEMKKTKKVSNLRNSNGVDYAPWMGISEGDEDKIRQLMKEKANARKMRQEQERDVSGALLMDSQSQELSGTGLKYKVVDNQVELEWATGAEDNTKGFLVKRRKSKTTDFEVIASYENWGPLLSKGEEGGVYRYLDTSVVPGGWVYRVTECDNNGREFDICQCLVELQTKEEEIGAFVAAATIVLLAVGAVYAGLTLDPIDGY